MIGLVADKNQQLFKIFHPGSAASTGPVGRGGRKTVRTVLVFHRSGNVHVNYQRQIQFKLILKKKLSYWLKRTHGFILSIKIGKENICSTVTSSLNIPEIFLKGQIWMSQKVSPKSSSQLTNSLQCGWWGGGWPQKHHFAGKVKTIMLNIFPSRYIG